MPLASRNPRQAIVGPGAVGCFLAAELARVGREVWLVDHRPDRAQRLTARGLAIEGGDDRTEVPVRASADASVTASVEAVIVAVKAHATADVGARLAPHVADGTVVLTVQNGLGNVETLRQCLPGARVVAGVVYFGCRRVGEGHVVVTPNRALLVGGCDSGTTRQVQGLFAPTSVKVQLTGDIHRELWRKVLLNAVINPLTALHGVPNGALPDIREATATAERLLAEGTAVAAAEGHRFIPEELLSAVRETCERTATNVSSMRQDVETGRQTEIAAINGAIVRRGRAAGIAVPENTRIVGAIERLTAMTHSKR